MSESKALNHDSNYLTYQNPNITLPRALANKEKEDAAKMATMVLLRGLQDLNILSLFSKEKSNAKKHPSGC